MCGEVKDRSTAGLRERERERERERDPPCRLCSLFCAAIVEHVYSFYCGRNTGGIIEMIFYQEKCNKEAFLQQ